MCDIQQYSSVSYFSTVASLPEPTSLSRCEAAIMEDQLIMCLAQVVWWYSQAHTECHWPLHPYENRKYY